MLKPWLAIQQQGDAIEHPAGPLLARWKRAAVSEAGQIAIGSPYQPPCTGLRPNHSHQLRDRQPHNAAKHEGTVRIDDVSEIGRVARLQAHFDTEGQSERQTDWRISRNSHQESGR